MRNSQCQGGELQCRIDFGNGGGVHLQRKGDWILPNRYTAAAASRAFHHQKVGCCHEYNVFGEPQANQGCWQGSVHPQRNGQSIDEKFVGYSVKEYKGISRGKRVVPPKIHRSSKIKASQLQPSSHDINGIPQYMLHTEWIEVRSQCRGHVSVAGQESIGRVGRGRQATSDNGIVRLVGDDPVTQEGRGGDATQCQ